MFKKTFIVMLLLIFFSCFFNIVTCASGVSQEENTQNLNDYYEEAFRDSGANDLWDKVPKEAQKSLEDIGVTGSDWQSLTKLNIGNIFNQIWMNIQKQFKLPLKSMAQVISVIMLCALLEGLKLSFEERPLSKAISVIGTLCICIVLVQPIVDCIDYTCSVIKMVSTFMLAFIPIIVGIMIVAGQSFSAYSYNIFMVGASQVISQISSWLLIPMANSFLALSIVSSISPKLSLNKIGDLFYSASKWILGIITTIFVGLLTLSNLVTSASDSASNKAIKFAVNSFVPVVGSALGEAVAATQGYMKLLKSGVGVFALISIAVIFVPVMIKCILWIATVNICAVISDVFDISPISTLLRSMGKVIGVLIAIIICCISVFIVSTAITLVIGGGTS